MALITVLLIVPLIKGADRVQPTQRMHDSSGRLKAVIMSLLLLEYQQRSHYETVSPKSSRIIKQVSMIID